MTGAPPLLEVDRVSVRHGHVLAVDEITIDVAAGQTVAILGRNGAGKSSLLAAIAGSCRIASGDIRVAGISLKRDRADQRVRGGVALVPEGRRIFTNLTIEENLTIGGFSRPADEIDDALGHIFELFPVLRDRQASLGGELSGGQQQMLAIGRALMSRPRLLLLDEPSLGLAPRVIGEVYEHIAALRESGIAVLLVEQQVQRALDVAAHILVLHLGRVILEGSPADVAGDPRLVDAYTGGTGTEPTVLSSGPSADDIEPQSTTDPDRRPRSTTYVHD